MLHRALVPNSTQEEEEKGYFPFIPHPHTHTMALNPCGLSASPQVSTQLPS